MVLTVADLDLNEVTPAQLAVDREIEQCSTPRAAFSIQEEADCPYLSGLKARFARTFLPAFQALRACARSYCENPMNDFHLFKLRDSNACVELIAWSETSAMPALKDRPMVGSRHSQWVSGVIFTS